MTGRLATFFTPLDVLLLFVPIALLAHHQAPSSHVAIFVCSGLAIVPLAGILGRATEQLADRLGEGIGGLLNATFGNAAELIIALVALRAGLFELVKASLVGSILGNILLVLGASFLAGGLRHHEQRYNLIAAKSQSEMLVVSTTAMIVPAVFYFTSSARPELGFARHTELSLAIAGVMLLVYILSLVFSLVTHRDAFAGEPVASPPPSAHGHWSMKATVIAMTAATAGIAWMSEMLIGSVEQAAHGLGLSPAFVGIIILAVVGNAAEHSTAVMAAMKNRMDLSVGIAIGSSTQVALFVLPVLVFLSLFLAPEPMNMVLTRGQVVMLFLSNLILGHATSDGASNWFNGVQLLAVYLIIAVACYFIP